MKTVLVLFCGSFLLAGSALYGNDDQSKKGNAPAKASGTDALVGIWEGTLSAPPGIELQMVVKVTKPQGSAAKATLDVPDQNAKGIPVSIFSLDGDEVTIALKAIAAEFKGKCNEAKTAIVGKWKQGPIVLPLTLKKVDSVSERRRPQTPRAPFPYKVEEVTYPSKAAGVRLAGTLTMPEGKGPFPALLMITG